MAPRTSQFAFFEFVQDSPFTTDFKEASHRDLLGTWPTCEGS